MVKKCFLAAKRERKARHFSLKTVIDCVMSCYVGCYAFSWSCQQLGSSFCFMCFFNALSGPNQA